ncbi:class I SAM-dependent methyltransferase [Noviherbaspirillum galbum]|uniref:Class I SAM-dependent methyltransferase n=1 Tax=Noviherbaspirillum galbum TaxID=2709383 RepID=A0A6B3SR76_9BURK|nr:SAM-dependent methyltransferase [Noviherbaspirillum galbum]NEX63151.1 class I SAM-dependent methyltransferase [Noviherbaspirillum galbum]
MQLQLPVPSPDALAASRRLRLLIADDIRRQGGWIPFSRYMELLLYAPDLGYYSGGAAKLGKDGDFTTAPEITPLFGAAIARVVATMMQETGPRLMEFGAGTGKLAFDILTECAALGVAVERYDIIDLSGELRARQQETLRAFPQVRWLERMPDAFSGVAVGNEVLDAMPVSLVVKTEHGWLERGVLLAEAAGAEDFQFAFGDRPSAWDIAASIPDADGLPAGYVTEIHPVAEGFMRSLSAMLARGAESGQGGQGAAAILIDYGFPAAEYYHPQRAQGTLMCHYRHHSHPDAFYLPGLQDVTAHVNFSSMATAAAEAGADVLGYASHAAFLLDAGIGEALLRTSPDDKLRYLPQANAVQRLISPAEMGELFKVLVVGKGTGLPPNFHRNDRSHRL